jgi:ribosome biogenesis GTPase A
MKSYNKKCIGCGVDLQTTDKDGLGYVPESSLKDNKDVYCQRCFKLRNYGNFEAVSVLDDEFKMILKQIKREKALVVYVLDVFDIHGSFVENLNGMIGDNPVILVGNKFDVLPKSLKERKIKDRLKRYANQNNVVNVEDVILTSAIKNLNIEKLVKTIDRYDFEKTYFVGTTNVGKSTIINAIINMFTDAGGELITTSK